MVSFLCADPKERKTKPPKSKYGKGGGSKFEKGRKKVTTTTLYIAHILIVMSNGESSGSKKEKLRLVAKKNQALNNLAKSVFSPTTQTMSFSPKGIFTSGLRKEPSSADSIPTTRQ